MDTLRIMRHGDVHGTLKWAIACRTDQTCQHNTDDDEIEVHQDLQLHMNCAV